MNSRLVYVLHLVLCLLVSISVYGQKATFTDFYYIKSTCGKYLTVQNGNGNAVSPVALSDYNGSLAQQWKFVLAEEDHIFYIAVGANPLRPFVTNDAGQIWCKSKP